MNAILKSVLNRGAPINTPVMFDLHEFFGILDNEEVYKDYRKNIVNIISELSNILDYFGGTILLPTEAVISMSDTNTKELTFPGVNLHLNISEIFYDVDVDEVLDACDHPEKFQELKKKILAIKTPEELKAKMPRLYDLYNEQQTACNNLLELENLVNDPRVDFEVKIRNLSRITNGLKELYSNFDLKREQEFAKRFSVPVYLERLLNGIENLLNNIEEVTAIYQSGTLELNSLTEEDKDKIDLYMAAKFLEKIEEVEKNKKQRYLFYLTNYFKENVETRVKRVKIKLHGRKVTPINLYERYKEIMVENPELLAVNFTSSDFRDMTKEEIEEFIVAYLADLSANWELLPPDDTSVEKTIRSIARRKNKKLTPEEIKARENKLINLYIEKKNFYDSTDPYFRIKGKNTFDGYVGYIYDNSTVILERFYENAENKKIASNQAIYVMSMSDFYELSRHSKTYLITHELCKRIIHKGAWQDKVRKCIKRKSEEENPSVETRKLIDANKVLVNEPKKI